MRTFEARSYICSSLGRIFQPTCPARPPSDVSSAVLSALRPKGKWDLSMFELPNVLASPMFSIDPKTHPNVFDYQTTYKLRRVESGPREDGADRERQKNELPAIHAMAGATMAIRQIFFFLDDESNPLSLKWRLGRSGTDRDTLQVVKIATGAAPGISLGTPGSARSPRPGAPTFYDIYFSFNSDEIREESKPTLKEIGDRVAPSPRLEAECRWPQPTGIAGGRVQSRSVQGAARRQSRIGAGDGFCANAERLTTTGYGKSRPQRNTNEPPEGRARIASWNWYVLAVRARR